MSSIGTFEIDEIGCARYASDLFILNNLRRLFTAGSTIWQAPLSKDTYVHIPDKQATYAPFRVKMSNAREFSLQMVGVRDQEGHDPKTSLKPTSVGNYNLRGSNLCSPLRVEAKSVKLCTCSKNCRPANPNQDISGAGISHAEPKFASISAGASFFGNFSHAHQRFGTFTGPQNFSLFSICPATVDGALLLRKLHGKFGATIISPSSSRF